MLNVGTYQEGLVLGSRMKAGYSPYGVAVVYDMASGELRELGTLPGQQSSMATGISGRIVTGVSYDENRENEPFVYDLDTGVMRPLTGQVRDSGSITDISGDRVVGYYSSDFEYRGFIYDLTTGTTQDIPALPGSKYTLPSQIEGDWVIGKSGRAFAYNVATKELRDLGVLPGHTSSAATAMYGTTVVGRSGGIEDQAATITTLGSKQPTRLPGLPSDLRSSAGPINASWIAGSVGYRTPWVASRKTGEVTYLQSPPGDDGLRVIGMDGDVIAGAPADLRAVDRLTLWERRPAVDRVTPSIGGTARVGSTLWAYAGPWGPEGVSVSYQWYRDGKAIAGATGRTRLLTTMDAKSRMSVEVTGRKAGLASQSATSTPTSRVALGVLRAPTPTLSGTPRVGSTLRLYRGAWSPRGVELSQRWYRDGRIIFGEFGPTRKVTSADRGHRITAKVTGRRFGYSNLVKTTAATTRAR
ncbi:hypothetical protein [Janibacter melonis]|uniref:hypothetical protein n=2 Tax=Janibacter melonis TaxID=262209 RepID=UPI00191A1312|nr:hypothetical protein [Janibacter melonis]